MPGKISIKDAFYFAWSHPVSVIITGADNAVMLQEKINLVNTFKPLGESQCKRLVAKVADLSREGIEYYKSPY